MATSWELLGHQTGCAPRHTDWQGLGLCTQVPPTTTRVAASPSQLLVGTWVLGHCQAASQPRAVHDDPGLGSRAASLPSLGSYGLWDPCPGAYQISAAHTRGRAQVRSRAGSAPGLALRPGAAARPPCKLSGACGRRGRGRQRVIQLGRGRALIGRGDRLRRTGGHTCAPCGVLAVRRVRGAGGFSRATCGHGAA